MDYFKTVADELRRQPGLVLPTSSERAVQWIAVAREHKEAAQAHAKKVREHTAHALAIVSAMELVNADPDLVLAAKEEMLALIDDFFGAPTLDDMLT